MTYVEKCNEAQQPKVVVKDTLDLIKLLLSKACKKSGNMDEGATPPSMRPRPHRGPAAAAWSWQTAWPAAGGRRPPRPETPPDPWSRSPASPAAGMGEATPTSSNTSRARSVPAYLEVAFGDPAPVHIHEGQIFHSAREEPERARPQLPLLTSNHPLTTSPPHSLTHSLSHSITPSSSHPLTASPSHPLTPSHSHRITPNSSPGTERRSNCQSPVRQYIESHGIQCVVGVALSVVFLGGGGARRGREDEGEVGGGRGRRGRREEGGGEEGGRGGQEGEGEERRGREEGGGGGWRGEEA